MVVLIPGRHHLLTKFQRGYLERLVRGGADAPRFLDGSAMGERVDEVVFAVTSANHDGTRRNPVPFHLRAVQMERFSEGLGVPCRVFGIDDVGEIPDFADYVAKKIRHDSDGTLDPDPAAWTVLCSTRVLEQWERLGYRILPAELADRATWRYAERLPWDGVEAVIQAAGELGDGWPDDPVVASIVHPASIDVWRRYGLAERTRRIFADDMLGDDGDLTETRDYNEYVREMDDIADLKWDDTGAFVKPGRIGDIGCAVGSWIKRAASEPRLRESDFYGVELSRVLYSMCLRRKEAGEFPTPDVFFARKNAVERVFPERSMNTVHTSSLTHEIYSYGSAEELAAFVAARFSELAPGGAWINRDVIGPDDGSRRVLAWFRDDDGANPDDDDIAAFPRDTGDGPEGRDALEAAVSALSTMARWRLFLRDWSAPGSPSRGEAGPVYGLERDGKRFWSCEQRLACDFALKKDYADNWASEMREAFCFRGYSGWKAAVEAAGFSVSPLSRRYRNEWIMANRIRGRVALYAEDDAGCLHELEWPETHMVMVSVRTV